MHSLLVRPRREQGRETKKESLLKVVWVVGNKGIIILKKLNSALSLRSGGRSKRGGVSKRRTELKLGKRCSL